MKIKVILIIETTEEDATPEGMAEAVATMLGETPYDKVISASGEVVND